MFTQLHGMSPGIGKIAAHGVAGGIMSEMQGGSFKSGFLAAGFTQALSPAISGIDSGTVGPSVQRTIAGHRRPHRQRYWRRQVRQWGDDGGVLEII